MLRFLSLCWVLARLGAAVEVPAGLRPAKALGEATAEQRVVPELQLDPAAEPSPPAGARAPPNLSLRSRLIAAQNSAAASQDDVVDRQPVEAEFKQPVVFTKARASARAAKTVEKPTKPAEKPRSPSSVQNLPRVTGPPPPHGNYGVNTILQTNLVDSNGRVIKGVSSVPIRVPPVEPKPGRSSAREVDVDGAKLPIEFGQAQRVVRAS